MFQTHNFLENPVALGPNAQKQENERRFRNISENIEQKLLEF
jgi:hypothetical protein